MDELTDNIKTKSLTEALEPLTEQVSNWCKWIECILCFCVHCHKVVPCYSSHMSIIECIQHNYNLFIHCFTCYSGYRDKFNFTSRFGKSSWSDRKSETSFQRNYSFDTHILWNTREENQIAQPWFNAAWISPKAIKCSWRCVEQQFTTHKAFRKLFGIVSGKSCRFSRTYAWSDSLLGPRSYQQL